VILKWITCGTLELCIMWTVGRQFFTNKLCDFRHYCCWVTVDWALVLIDSKQYLSCVHCFVNWESVYKGLSHNAYSFHIRFICVFILWWQAIFVNSLLHALLYSRTLCTEDRSCNEHSGWSLASSGMTHRQWLWTLNSFLHFSDTIFICFVAIMYSNILTQINTLIFFWFGPIDMKSHCSFVVNDELDFMSVTQCEFCATAIDISSAVNYRVGQKNRAFLHFPEYLENYKR